MSRKRRSEGLVPTLRLPAGREMPDEVPWRTVEVLQIWCPVCGKMAEAEQYENAPHAVEAAVQKFGGKLEDGRGYMKYFEVFPSEREQILLTLLGAVDKARQDILAELGLTDPEEEETPLGGYRPAPRIERAAPQRTLSPPPDGEEMETLAETPRRRSIQPPAPPVTPPRRRQVAKTTEPRKELPPRSQKGRSEGTQKRVTGQPDRLGLPEPKKEE